MRIYGIIIFCCIATQILAQRAATETAETSDKAAVRDPVSFTHQPFLLLKFTPTALVANDNVMQAGLEIAPPVGKFSFNFAYGIGSSKWSLNKFARENFKDSKTTVIRGEIRGYFSDWYPFYALDKKPFGRYYALEYVQKNVSRTQPVWVGSGAVGFPNYLEVADVPVVIKEQAVNVKFGKHFLLSRFLFLDGFIGLGPGRYKVSSNDPTLANESFIRNNFTVNRKNWQVGSKGWFLSKTAGLSVCLVF